MKFLSLILIILLPYTIFSVSQEDEKIIDEIAIAISQGNAGNLAQYFNETVDLTLPDKEGTFSKSQAELIMKDFFDKNPPDSFEINHKGSSNKGSLYAIGTYQTSSISYRSYMLLKEISGVIRITQLRIEED
jgi:hypothetical protein